MQDVQVTAVERRKPLRGSSIEIHSIPSSLAGGPS